MGLTGAAESVLTHCQMQPSQQANCPVTKTKGLVLGSESPGQLIPINRTAG